MMHEESHDEETLADVQKTHDQDDDVLFFTFFYGQ
jgi:hypothetical protein